MLNLEGVILGNHRCCNVGYDPNKMWNSYYNEYKVK